MLDGWCGVFDCLENANCAVDCWIEEIFLGVLDIEVELDLISIDALFKVWD